jgi:hypothetical protein
MAWWVRKHSMYDEQLRFNGNLVGHVLYFKCLLQNSCGNLIAIVTILRGEIPIKTKIVDVKVEW